LGVFEEEVGEVGEFAHEGDERGLGGFACGAQALIKWSEHGVMSGGGQLEKMAAVGGGFLCRIGLVCLG